MSPKLELLDGVVLKTEEEDMAGLLNGRPMQTEYEKASPDAHLEDDNKVGYELTLESVIKFGEDARYIITEKIHGVEPRGKLEGAHGDHGSAAYQSVYMSY